MKLRRVTRPATAAEPLNAWALPKEKMLRAALIAIVSRLGPDHVAQSTRRCEHAGAVVLCKPEQPEVVAYLYTFGQPAGHFGLQLDYPEFPDQPTQSPDVHEGLPLTRVVDLLRTHFDVA